MFNGFSSIKCSKNSADQEHKMFLNKVFPYFCYVYQKLKNSYHCRNKLTMTKLEKCENSFPETINPIQPNLHKIR